MKILITGTEGYIGARLAPMLARAGTTSRARHRLLPRRLPVHRSDRGMPIEPQTAFKDLRTVTPADFEGIDAVVHLAELSNDPLGENRPEITFKINHEGSSDRAGAPSARAASGASSMRRRAASTDVGIGRDAARRRPTNPQTVYAKCKVAGRARPAADGG